MLYRLRARKVSVIYPVTISKCVTIGISLSVILLLFSGHENEPMGVEMGVKILT